MGLSVPGPSWILPAALLLWPLILESKLALLPFAPSLPASLREWATETGPGSTALGTGHSAIITNIIPSAVFAA